MKNRRLMVLSAFACALLAGDARGTALAQTVVVPNALETVEGNFNNVFPFAISSHGLNSQRYQQVYAASEFSNVGGPIRITEIAFRPDAQWGDPFSVVLPAVQIHLSTTAAAPDGLSAQFAANVGPDDTVVFDGPLALESKFTGSGPMDFDIRIRLTDSFVYDPSRGNLLLDVRNLQGVPFDIPFDAQDQVGNPSARVYSFNAPESVLDPEGFTDRGSKIAMVTRFTYEQNGDPGITVSFDIRPGGCPNPWNVRADSVLPAAITGSKDFDVARVDAASVLLAGVPALRHSFEDVSAPFQPHTGKLKSSDCSSTGPDGYPDLTLKFPSQQIWSAAVAALGREAYDGEVLILPVTGNLHEHLGGTPIYGEDIVVVLKKGKK